MNAKPNLFQRNPLILPVPSFIPGRQASIRNTVKNEKSGQQKREEFYSSSMVRKHIKEMKIPTTVGAFKDMVASGSNLNLDSSEGLDLIETLGHVTFARHPQQINIMDKSSGKMIVSIPI